MSLSDILCLMTICLTKLLNPLQRLCTKTTFSVSQMMMLWQRQQINVPYIIAYKNIDERKLTLELTYDRESIFNFIKTASTPSMVEFHSELHFSNVKVSLDHALTSPFQEVTMCARLGFDLAISPPRLLRSELGSLKQRSRWLRRIRTRSYLAQLTCKTLLHLQIVCILSQVSCHPSRLKSL